MAANAIVAGPHAFGGREQAVVVMVCTGIVVAVLGVRMFTGARHARKAA
jgi:hypothetical protein